MATLSRFLSPLPAAGCRSYSSFFSRSGSGSGRFFNSARTPKSVVPGTTPTKNGVKADVSSLVSSEASESSSLLKEHARKEPVLSSTALHTTLSSPPNVIPGTLAQARLPISHPSISSKDLKLHQFFALHRPLLLIHNPSLILQTAPRQGPLYPEESAAEANVDPVDSQFAIRASIEADAETARQISRGLTLHSAASAVAWQDTLRRLGDTSQDILQADHGIAMDSTKRKRRKKMKKHKLKKRQRATRQQVKK